MVYYNNSRLELREDIIGLTVRILLVSGLALSEVGVNFREHILWVNFVKLGELSGNCYANFFNYQISLGYQKFGI